jgi:Replication-relaxation
MARIQLANGDLAMLSALAEYRLLCTRHLAIVLDRNTRALRRRLHQLQAEDLITMQTPRQRKGRGRPEQLIGLAQQGAEVLKREGVLHADTQLERVLRVGPYFVEHRLLINEFRLQLEALPPLESTLTVRFLSPDSPFLPRLGGGGALGHERVDIGEEVSDLVEFVSDGVVGITDRQSKKTALFFLEADRGTEPLRAAHRKGGDVQSKIRNYQAYFRVQSHKRYGRVWKGLLKGFRVLFLAHNERRLSSLCELTRSLPPSDFVWFTHRGDLSARGLWSEIWVRGGRQDRPRESILGSRTPSSCPTPAEVFQLR